jgi:non-heme chloroperoxidase
MPTVTVGKENSGDIQLYYEDHGSGDPVILVQASWNVAVAASPAASRACVAAWHEDFRSDVAQIDVPTLVMQGTADRIVPIAASGRRTAQLIGGARLVTVPDGPHAVNWTHAEEVNAELVSFLAKEAAKRAAPML